jgi:surface polysaccharide O-acyltransferase-like enzyme
MPAIRAVATRTLGIYLAHPLFLGLIGFVGSHPSAVMGMLTLTAFCLVASLVLTWLLHLNRFTARLVG